MARLHGINGNDMVLKLREYLERREEVLMAFLFGSWARGVGGVDSDVDIAIYFQPPSGFLQWDDPTARYESEDEIWLDLEEMLGREVDLLVLNRAVPTVAESALRGIPIVIKDRGVYLDYLTRVTFEAFDFRTWIESYFRLKERVKYAT